MPAPGVLGPPLRTPRKSDRVTCARLLGALIGTVMCAGYVALHVWFQPLDVWGMDELTGEELPLQQLRELGEQAARRYPGAKDMGRTSSDKTYFRRVQWARVQESCAPQAGSKVVLVTGTGGFIGMHAALALRKRGDGVVGLDNFNDYYPVSLKRARQARCEAAGVHTVDGDINDAALLQKLFETCRFTHVLHLAAQAGVRYATRNPYSYVHANVGGQVTLLEVMKDQQPMPGLVYASSSSVYGLNKQQPFSELDRVDVPASLYAATKRADELISHVYYNIHGISVTGLRFFTVYGPWGRPDMAAYKFAVSIMKGQAIKVFKGPEGEELRRDFTYISDIAAGVVAALDAIPPSGHSTKHFKVYNLGNTHPQTVTDLVGCLEKELDREAVKREVPVPPTGDVLATFANVSLSMQDLGYKPTITLEEGVRQFALWFKDYYGPSVMQGGVIPADWAYDPL